MPYQPEPSLSTWSAPESPVSIDYPASLLQQIHAYALDGFQRLSRGGMEVGGVLFGTRRGDRLALQAWRPISCEYSRGPSFTLSDADKSDLQKLLAASIRDPELRGLEPLGWFVSHTRSGLALLPSDRELFREYFPERWQVTLLLHPQRNASTRAGFFVHEQDGGIPDSALSEFEIAPDDSEAVKRPRERREPAGRARSAEADAPRFSLGETRREFPWRLLLAIGAILVIVIAAGAAVYRYLQPPAAAGPFSFEAVDANGQLRIHWDQSAKAVRDATRGVLEIKDGARTSKLDLDAAQVHNGSVTYTRRSDDVELRLIVYQPSGTSLTRLSHFIGPPPPASDELQALREERNRLSAEVATLQNALQAERGKSSKLERENRLRDRLLQLDGVIGRHRAPAAK